MSSDQKKDPPSATDIAKANLGPYGHVLPPDRAVWREARRLATDTNLKVEDLATCVSQDPVLVMEFLKTSNAISMSAGRQTISSVKGAIIRLGSQLVAETLENLEARPDIENPDVAHWFEVHRSRCKRTAIIARMLSELSARNLTDECQAAGLLLHTGELIAVVHFQELYVQLADELSRSGILYRLVSEHRFDADIIGTTYLTRHGIPSVLTAAISRDASMKVAPDKMIMRPVVQGASELVEAFDSNRWEKIAPGKPTPAKSAIRALGLNDSQYLKLYERAAQYLFLIRQMEERQKVANYAAANPPVPVVEEKHINLDTNLDFSLESEISDLLHQPEPPAQHTSAPREEPAKAPTVDDVHEAFSLSGSSKPKDTPRITDSKVMTRPNVALSRAKKVVDDITKIFETTASSEELLSLLLDQMVKHGPFEKSAIIVVSKDRKQALVVAARGPNIGNGQKITIDDELSPLAQCFSKVMSYGSGESAHSPFGSSTFALAPIDADHETPVALYADCGKNGSISFEARRVFRNVVTILNEKLPQLPGGIPVEIN